MKKIISLFIAIILVSGCAHRASRQKVVPDKPYESPTVYNFKSTDKDKAKVFQTMGMDYLSQRELMQAQTYLKKALKLDHTLYKSWFCLGLLNMDSQDGYDYLQKSIECKPDFVTPYYWMAYYQCRLGQDQKAIALFRKYIELAKNEPGEDERLSSAKQVLKELLSGKDGELLKTIRSSK